MNEIIKHRRLLMINEVEKSSCGTSLNDIKSDSYRTRAPYAAKIFLLPKLDPEMNVQWKNN